MSVRTFIIFTSDDGGPRSGPRPARIRQCDANPDEANAGSVTTAAPVSFEPKRVRRAR